MDPLDINVEIYQQMMDCLIYFINTMFDVGYHARGLISQFMAHPQKNSPWIYETYF
jgi:hypothetical protein